MNKGIARGRREQDVTVGRGKEGVGDRGYGITHDRVSGGMLAWSGWAVSLMPQTIPGLSNFA